LLNLLSQGRGRGGAGARGSSSIAPRGGGSGARHGPQGPQPTMDKPKREAILDLSKYVNEKIRVKFTGGREGFVLFLSIYVYFAQNHIHQ
jgi:U6 snRNA-associated Sm-like protein LSm7